MSELFIFIIILSEQTSIIPTNILCTLQATVKHIQRVNHLPWIICIEQQSLPRYNNDRLSQSLRTYIYYHKYNNE